MKIETESEPLKKEPRRVRAANVTPKRALVVNDEPALRMLIQDVLGSADIEGVISGGLEEADGHFEGEKFDVILVGVCGPSSVGIEFVRKTRESGFNRKTPIIFMSDDQLPGALTRAFDAGVTFFAYKPIDKLHLTRLIRVAQGTIEHEKRRFRRVPVRAKILLKFDQSELVCETIDLSLNGALVRTSHTFPLGSAVEVTLYVHGEINPIVGGGSVVRILNSNQMGILFDRLPIAESARLQGYLLTIIAG